MQGVMQEVLTKITGAPVILYASGRTDAGVHALGQVCNFWTASAIPPEKYATICRLPKDIQILSSELAENKFHAQHSAFWKRYRYLLQRSLPSVFEHRFKTFYPYNLNLKLMRAASSAVLGNHDFSSFCSAKATVKSLRRTIYQFSIKQEDRTTVFEVVGNGFLYNMVRIMVGTLCKIGQGKLIDLKEVLEARERSVAGPTMPPEGLYLVQVGYQHFTK
ncbi:MAG: tRNA pseudouridine(38-40) synthase TruA [Bacillota bacterium]